MRVVNNNFEKLKIEIRKSLKKNLANAITMLRIIFSFMLLYAVSFSFTFWIYYLICIISDALDGFVARRFKVESMFGAKLDSIADIIFVLCMLLVIIINKLYKYLFFDLYVLIFVLLIFLIRITSYVIGYIKNHCLCVYHTILNKITGFALYISPALFYLFGITVTMRILILISLLASVYDLKLAMEGKKSIM